MEIDIKLLKIQNQWWDSGDLKYDLLLLRLETGPFKFRSKILDQVDLEPGRISLIQGPRGVGKTRAMKMLINELISKQTDPKNIFYYSCHNLNSKEQLNEIIKTFIDWRRNKESDQETLYIFIDEVTLIKDWEKGIEYLSEAGILKNISLLFSGSLHFSSKQCKLKIKDIQVNGLSFNEFFALMDEKVHKELLDKPESFGRYQKRLEYFLDIYVLTGGYISAINSFKKDSYVRQEIYSSYLYWMIADVARMGRDLILFRQILEQITEVQGIPFGYQAFTKKTKAQTHNTVADYIRMLQSLFVVQALYQFDSDKGINRSSSKKLYFRDPFIFWVFYAYLHGSLSYWQFSREYIHEKKIFLQLLENLVFCHLLKEEKAETWEMQAAFWRESRRKEEIPFISITENGTNPIIMRYDEIISNGDMEIFKRAGFRKGTIITRNLHEERGSISLVPLVYFLFYS